MSEEIKNEKMDEVSGGKNNNKKEVKSDLPRLVDPGDPWTNPTFEYTCPNCGCKYLHRNPGSPNCCSATAAVCPKCGKYW